MSHEDIIKLARAAGFGIDSLWVTYPSLALPHLLERFASLVAAKEREACAKVAEDCAGDCYIGDADWEEAKRCAAAIRERGMK